jgi:hypothetical protein
MSIPASTVERLRADLHDIEEELAALVAISPTTYFDQSDNGFIFVGAPDYYFSKPSSDQLRLQVALKARHDRWLERFFLLFSNPPSDLGTKIEKAKTTLQNKADAASLPYAETPTLLPSAGS